jgi:O-antigen ligase
MIIKRIDHLFDIVFSILLLSLSISMAVPNILLGVLFLLFLLKKKKKIFSVLYIKLLGLFVLFIFTKAIFFESFIDNIYLYKHLVVILLLSLLVFNTKNIYSLIKAYVLGVFIGVIISVVNIFNFYLDNNFFPFGNTSQVLDLLLIHRPYFGFMCFVAIVLIYILINKAKSKKEKKVFLILGIIILGFLFTIVARLSLLLALSYIILRVIMRFKLSKTKLIFAMSLCIFVLAGIFLVNKNIKNRFYIKDSYKETVKVLKNQEPRFVIWNCSLKQLKESEFNIFIGHKNRSEIQDNLTACYNLDIDNVSKRNYYLKTNFNTHNQFVDIFLDGGLIGFVLFTVILLLCCYFFRNNFDAIFILFGMSFFLLVENLFHRQLGVYLFGTFIPLFYKMITVQKE